MARILRVTAYRLLLVVTRGLFRTSPGLLSALVLACGVLCTLRPKASPFPQLISFK